ACCRCGHPLGSVTRMTGRTYLSGDDGGTIVDLAPTFDEPTTPSPQRIEPEDIEPPLVGQADAVMAIRDALAASLERGRPTLVALEGDRGSGKTRLLFAAS